MNEVIYIYILPVVAYQKNNTSLHAHIKHMRTVAKAIMCLFFSPLLLLLQQIQINRMHLDFYVCLLHFIWLCLYERAWERLCTIFTWLLPACIFSYYVYIGYINSRSFACLPHYTRYLMYICIYMCVILNETETTSVDDQKVRITFVTTRSSRPLYSQLHT